MAQFRDTTGRPGPSTWIAGHYPEGAADFPVMNVLRMVMGRDITIWIPPTSTPGANTVRSVAPGRPGGNLRQRINRGRTSRGRTHEISPP
jgi:hypothetical protein